MVLCCLAALGMVGCKGDNAPFRGETQFTGAWAGTWSVPGTADFGTLTFTVAENSTMIGTVQNLGTGELGIVRGATHPDGLFNASFTWDGTGAVMGITGAMALEGSDTRDILAGDGIYTRPGSTGKGFTFDMNREGGTISPFARTLGGTWVLPGGGEGGDMFLTVSINGQMSGTFTNDATGVGGSIKGRVLDDGQFIGAFIENGTGTRIEIEGIMANMSDNGLAGDGTFTRPGQAPQGFTFVLPNADEEGA